MGELVTIHRIAPGVLDDKMARFSILSTVSLLILGALPGRVWAEQILKTSGFSSCLTGGDITVQHLDIQYNADTMEVTFNVAGTSTKSMNVTAILNVTVSSYLGGLPFLHLPDLLIGRAPSGLLPLDFELY